MPPPSRRVAAAWQMKRVTRIESAHIFTADCRPYIIDAIFFSLFLLIHAEGEDRIHIKYVINPLPDARPCESTGLFFFPRWLVFDWAPENKIYKNKRAYKQSSFFDIYIYIGTVTVLYIQIHCTIYKIVNTLRVSTNAFLTDMDSAVLRLI